MNPNLASEPYFISKVAFLFFTIPEGFLTSGFQSKSFAEPPSYIVVEHTPRANRILGRLVASLESKPTSGIQRENELTLLFYIIERGRAFSAGWWMNVNSTMRKGLWSLECHNKILIFLPFLVSKKLTRKRRFTPIPSKAGIDPSLRSTHPDYRHWL